MSHLHHFPESGRASSKEKIMNDDQIFDVLEKCKKDLEFETLKNAIQGLVQLFIKNRIIRAREIIPKFKKCEIESKIVENLNLLDETKSGIWNRVNLIRKISKLEDLKISISSLATVKMHLEQFLVFEIHSYLSPG